MALFQPFDPDGLPGRRQLRPLAPVPVRLVLPNLITLLALCAGLTSIRMAAEQQFAFAIAFIAIEAKHKRTHEMYFLSGLKKEYSRDGDDHLPNDHFLAEYNRLGGSRLAAAW